VPTTQGNRSLSGSQERCIELYQLVSSPHNYVVFHKGSPTVNALLHTASVSTSV